eukprot:1228635-Pleurochrysis_carterae.AAC.1
MGSVASRQRGARRGNLMTGSSKRRRRRLARRRHASGRREMDACTVRPSSDAAGDAALKPRAKD